MGKVINGLWIVLLSHPVGRFSKFYTIHNSAITRWFIISEYEKNQQKQEDLVPLVSLRFCPFPVCEELADHAVHGMYYETPFLRGTRLQFSGEAFQVFVCVGNVRVEQDVCGNP